MIAFLLNVYVLVVWLVFFKFKLLAFDLKAKVASGVIGVLLVFGILIAVNFLHPQTFDATVFNHVTQVSSRLPGPARVTEVVVEPNVPVKRGDVLFRLDARPYEDAVQQIEAQLAGAAKNVEALNAAAEAADAAVVETERGIDAAKAGQVSAAAAVSASEAAVAEAEATVGKASAAIENISTQLASARSEFGRIEALNRQTAATDEQLDQAKIRVTGYEKQLDSANADKAVAGQAVRAAEANVEAAKAQATAADLKVRQLADGTLAQTRAAAREARAAAESMIGGEHTTVAAARAQLEKAKFDLEGAVVRAPADGFVTNLQLRNGSVVAPGSPVMTFVENPEGVVVATFPQEYLGAIESGNRAEVTLDMYPGKTFGGTVETVIWATGAGQAAPGGTLPDPVAASPRSRFAVKIRIDDAVRERFKLPAGAGGAAAVYTEHGKSFGVVRKVVLRWYAWLNYLKVAM